MSEAVSSTDQSDKNRRWEKQALDNILPSRVPRLGRRRIAISVFTTFAAG